MSNDLLLEWVSERGDGSWAQFRRAHEWLFEGSQNPNYVTPGFTAGLLSMLGHIEVDWVAERWAACPPVLTLLPSAGAHALLTGGRTRALMADFNRELSEDMNFYPLEPHKQRFAPSAVLVPCESSADVQALAQRLGIAFEHSVSSRLAELLAPLDRYLNLSLSAAPARGYGFRVFDAHTLAWRDDVSDDTPGLYQYETHVGFAYMLQDDDGSTYKVDKAVGIYTALSRWGENRLRWFRKSVNGELVVPLRAPLPVLHARVAALCSGLAPEQRKDVLAYVNVPRTVAERMAHTLGQSLDVIG